MAICRLVGILLRASVGLLVTAMAFLLVFTSSAPSAEAGLTSPPTVAASSWTDAHAAAGSGFNQLVGVACPTSSFCVSVGFQNSGAGLDSLIEQWNGSTWTVASGVPADHTQLDGVSCAGPSFCMAVGGYGTALSYLWNGTTWSAEDVPIPPGTTFSNLGAVSCPTINVCEAVGVGDIVSTPVVFGEQWNGSSWSLADTGIDTGLAAGSELYAVSCVGGSWCQAVGVQGGSPTQDLIEGWNGVQWTIEPGVPQPSGADAALRGVDCFSATSCSAVGTQTPASGPAPAPSALEWDGSSWSQVSNPPLVQGAVSTTPTGESCVTNWACMAVGYYRTGASSFGSYAVWAPIARSGYRFVASDGGIFAYGAGAPFLGSTGGTPLNASVVGMSVMPAGDGYDLVASDGGIFTFGSAQFYGSSGGIRLNKPVVGMAVTPDGAGYWLVAPDGGIFTYGDASFYGSRGGQPLDNPIVGMAATPDGKGYFLVSSDGGVFTYGDAQFGGSLGGVRLNRPIVGISVPTSGGYYLVASDGGIFSFSSGTAGAPFYGSTGSIKLNKPIVGMAAVQGGYYLAGSDGGIFAFPTGGGGLPFYGSTGSIALNQPIVGIAS